MSRSYLHLSFYSPSSPLLWITRKVVFSSRTFPFRGVPLLHYLRMASSTSNHYDAILLGSGQGGNPLIKSLANSSLRTALIESTHIGGCCVNDGCTPTKTLIASGKIAYHARRAAEFGIHFPGSPDGTVDVDMVKVRERKRSIVESFRKGNETRLESAGVDIFRGRAIFTGPKTIKVEMNDASPTQTLSAENIFINTGERPSRPALPGLEDIPQERVLDSTSIQELGNVPSHLIVLGGGYIGLEFAQLFRRLGSKVTIVQRSSRLLPREDPEVTSSLLEILREDGIEVHLSSDSRSISSAADPPELSISLKIISKGTGPDAEKESTITGSHILLATGRTPNTDTLNLPAAGINATPKGHIQVNEYLQTSVEGVYALGDVKGGPAFTHISYDDFRILQHNILTVKSSSSASPLKSTKDRVLPYVCYTDPQVAHVGLHEAETRSALPDAKIQTASMPMSWVARALEMDESRGMMKAVVDAESKLILGFTCLGVEGGEVMAVVQTAMMAGLPYGRLQDAVWAHPSLAESLNNLWGNLK